MTPPRFFNIISRTEQNSTGDFLNIAIESISVGTGVPKAKFQQIADGVMRAITDGVLKRGDALPSVNQMCQRWSISRDTVVKAYDHLKKLGVITASPRKGYFVATESIDHTVKVFLLIDSFDPYMQILYKALKENLGEKALVDVYFHHCNFKIFETLIMDNLGQYGSYIIKSFKEPRIPQVLSHLDPEQLIIIDRKEYIPQTCSYIAQDFDLAVHSCLTDALDRIKKYDRAVLVFPPLRDQPDEIKTAFEAFCLKHKLKYIVTDSLTGRKIIKGDWFLVIYDEDLVEIVKRCKTKNLKLGCDVGVISYNETPMKEIVADGISIITTDFAGMGRKAADFVLKPSLRQNIAPTRLILRNSF